MTRAECESKIAEHFEAIIKIAKEYNPNCQYITGCYTETEKGNTYQVNNAYFEEDADFPINFVKRIFTPFKNMTVVFDPITNSYSVLLDGKVEYEHLAQDELVEVVHELVK